MAVRRHGGSMMMVVTVMAVALHLFERLRESRPLCQIIFLQMEGGEAENGAVRVGTSFTAAAVAMLGLCLAVTALSQDRDTRGIPKTSAAAPRAEMRVDINHASVEELLKVPGMTRSWAGRIVRFRPYRTKQDLVERGVVTSQVYGQIKDYVIAHQKAQ